MPQSNTVNAIAVSIFGSVVIITALVFSFPSEIKLCSQGDCRTITNEQYQTLKHDFADRMEAGEPFSIDEWNQLVSIINHESAASHGLSLGVVNSPDDIKEAIVQKLRE